MMSEGREKEKNPNTFPSPRRGPMIRLNWCRIECGYKCNTAFCCNHMFRER
jgi:hypothetical protein